MVRVSYGSTDLEAGTQLTRKSDKFSRKVIGTLALMAVVFTALVVVVGFASPISLVGLGSGEEQENEWNADEAIRQGGVKPQANPPVPAALDGLIAQAACEQAVEAARAKAFVAGLLPPSTLDCAPAAGATTAPGATSPAAAYAKNQPQLKQMPKHMLHAMKKGVEDRAAHGDDLEGVHQKKANMDYA
mmetsp:Transcript_72144/g.108901  ORF Transcript_72144/g.108901 Transcript_72144/m.108901 type:complete len:188 (-) Transcript_72144:43-606(-)|eukprot:CAMPEP_0117028756 /NCGR_PEP_ID=MMETSP0472-20121206/20883_1 /TAXON_ID=693140 ORGANISM="Tiarina fusus, Strain LIS" /NCGR_SAMPLE_ID=MMETSP0472 /ASSEMBLY_ACC=CAM_ASM_000603 /LENGTH=187 /DNA_ID=CAMNT_0004736337 /DNA_START=26 /DNA_END=589 /DNA_ORIENTATION=-